MKFSWRKIIFNTINLIIASIITYFIYFFFFSPYYEIKNISVNGLQYIRPDEIINEASEHLEANRFLSLKSKNLLLYDLDSLRDNFDEKFLFSELSFTKVKPDTIRIDIAEKKITYRFTNLDYEYLMDDTGLLVKQVSSLASKPILLSLTPQDELPSRDERKSLLRTYNENDQFALLYLDNPDESLNIGLNVLGDDSATFLSALLTTDFPDLFKIRLISIPTKNPQYIRVTTEDGYDIILNPNLPLNGQIDSFRIVLDTKIPKSDLRRLDYIDLRLGNNIYFKYK